MALTPGWAFVLGGAVVLLDAFVLGRLDHGVRT